MQFRPAKKIIQIFIKLGRKFRNLITLRLASPSSPRGEHAISDVAPVPRTALTLRDFFLEKKKITSMFVAMLFSPSPPLRRARRDARAPCNLAPESISPARTCNFTQPATWRQIYGWSSFDGISVEFTVREVGRSACVILITRYKVACVPY